MFPKKRKADTQDEASFSNTARQLQSSSYPVQQSQTSVQQSRSKSRELRHIQSDPTIPIIQPVPSTPTIQPNPIIQPIPIPSTPFIQPVPTIPSVQPHQSYFQLIPPIHQYQYQSSPIP
ncbi:2146_t:CDS:1, partial [Gigaspora rosea]